MVTDDLRSEWHNYRDTCDRVDLIRYHSAFDSGTDLAERLSIAETLAAFLEEAIHSSGHLIAVAERRTEIDASWLDELRERHAELLLYADNTQDLIGETERRLRRPH